MNERVRVRVCASMRVCVCEREMSLALLELVRDGIPLLTFIFLRKSC